MTGRARRLTGAGTAILLLVFALWVGLLWLGWFLVFSADGTAVLPTPSGAPADGWERLYFTDSTIFTLGRRAAGRGRC